MAKRQEAGLRCKTTSRGRTERVAEQLPMPASCPTCGFPVKSIFDHVDRDEIDPKTGMCK